MARQEQPTNSSWRFVALANGSQPHLSRQLVRLRRRWTLARSPVRAFLLLVACIGIVLPTAAAAALFDVAGREPPPAVWPGASLTVEIVLLEPERHLERIVRVNAGQIVLPGLLRVGEWQVAADRTSAHCNATVQPGAGSVGLMSGKCAIVASKSPRSDKEGTCFRVGPWGILELGRHAAVTAAPHQSMAAAAPAAPRAEKAPSASPRPVETPTPTSPPGALAGAPAAGGASATLAPAGRAGDGVPSEQAVARVALTSPVALAFGEVIEPLVVGRLAVQRSWGAGGAAATLGAHLSGAVQAQGLSVALVPSGWRSAVAEESWWDIELSGEVQPAHGLSEAASLNVSVVLDSQGQRRSVAVVELAVGRSPGFIRIGRAGLASASPSPVPVGATLLGSAPGNLQLRPLESLWQLALGPRRCVSKLGRLVHPGNCMADPGEPQRAEGTQVALSGLTVRAAVAPECSNATSAKQQPRHFRVGLVPVLADSLLGAFRSFEAPAALDVSGAATECTMRMRRMSGAASESPSPMARAGSTQRGAAGVRSAPVSAATLAAQGCAAGGIRDGRGRCCRGLGADSLCCPAPLVVDDCGVCGGANQCSMLVSALLLSVTVNGSSHRVASIRPASAAAVAAAGLLSASVLAERLRGQLPHGASVVVDRPELLQQHSEPRAAISFPNRSQIRSADETGYPAPHPLGVVFRLRVTASGLPLAEMLQRLASFDTSSKSAAHLLSSNLPAASEPSNQPFALAFRRAQSEPRCGNGMCEFGEQGGCAADCPLGTLDQVANCLPEGNGSADLCSGGGVCDSLSGRCHCSTGYAGALCELCAAGFSRAANGTECVASSSGQPGGESGLGGAHLFELVLSLGAGLLVIGGIVVAWRRGKRRECDARLSRRPSGVELAAAPLPAQPALSTTLEAATARTLSPHASTHARRPQGRRSASPSPGECRAGLPGAARERLSSRAQLSRAERGVTDSSCSSQASPGAMSSAVGESQRETRVSRPSGTIGVSSRASALLRLAAERLVVGRSRGGSSQAQSSGRFGPEPGDASMPLSAAFEPNESRALADSFYLSSADTAAEGFYESQSINAVGYGSSTGTGAGRPDLTAAYDDARDADQAVIGASSFPTVGRSRTG